MKTIILLILLNAIPLASKAQFFNFGYGDDIFAGRTDRDRENYTEPKFQKGNKSIKKFLQKNFKNPPGQSRSTSGNIIVSCIIDTKGRVEKAAIARGLTEELNKEAVRVAKKMKFKPAKYGKKKVKSKTSITFPIRKGKLSFNNFETFDL